MTNPACRWRATSFTWTDVSSPEHTPTMLAFYEGVGPSINPVRANTFEMHLLQPMRVALPIGPERGQANVNTAALASSLYQSINAKERRHWLKLGTHPQLLTSLQELPGHAPSNHVGVEGQFTALDRELQWLLGRAVTDLSTRPHVKSAIKLAKLPNVAMDATITKSNIKMLATWHGQRLQLSLAPFLLARVDGPLRGRKARLLLRVWGVGVTWTGTELAVWQKIEVDGLELL